MESPRVVFFGIFLAFQMFRSGSACRFLKDPFFRTVGVTPLEAAEAEGLAIVVYGIIGDPHKRERIPFHTDAEERNQLDAFMLVYRNDSRDLMRQATTHRRRGGFKSSTVTCVKSDCVKPNAGIFTMLWVHTMYYVVVSCRGTHYIYNAFEKKVVPLKDPHRRTLFKQFGRIWSNMTGTSITVSYFQENLSFQGRRPDLGGGLDSSFLHEFSKYNNFVPVMLHGRHYKSSNLQVWTHQAEFGINARFHDAYEQKYTMSSVIYADDICVIARQKPNLRGWEVVQSLFHVEVWLCLPVILFVTISALSIVCRQRCWCKWLDVAFRSLFTLPVLDNVIETKERFILGSCFLFSIIFNSFVQAMLFKIVRTKPPVEFPSEQILYKYVHVMKGDPFNESSTIMRKNEYTLSVKEGLIKSQDYSIKCPGYSRRFSYILNYGSAIEPHINRFVRVAFEAGLPDAWFMKTITGRKQYVEDDSRVKVLNIVDFEVAFFELLFGMSISSLVFLGELVSTKISCVG